jgi:hypothetical protein
MNMLKQNIEDLKVIQSSYPNNSRGYQALNLAIVALSQLYETNEHMLSIVEPHWVAGESAGSITYSVSGPSSIKLTKDSPPNFTWLTLED